MPQKNAFKLDWGVHAILRMLSNHSFRNVLDIGSGEGEHRRFFEYFGKETFSVDIVKDADYVGDFIDVEFDRKFEAIWCSHVLEHQRNVGQFLDKIYDSLEDDGVLAIIVPNHPRERLISGHLTSWSIPLLCYNLIMAGFDCSSAEIFASYELSLIVRKKPAKHSELRNPSAHGADAGHEFDNIANYFPFSASQGLHIEPNGMAEINWPNPLEYKLSLAKDKIENLQINSKNLDSLPVTKPKLFLEKV
ncbi:MAG: methyltransferase domain-containing protein [Rhodospirillales bacterium]|nr:methyltransferase domain-containing protein [Rhodospirillales bacterium]